MKQKKSMIAKRLLSMAVAMCLLFAMSVTAFAANDAMPAVAEAREGVLQINLVYQEQNGTQHIVKTGSGFLLGASSGATTVITNYHVVSLNDEEKTVLSQLFGVDFFNLNNITMKVQAVVKRDVVIDASYVNGSEKTDFAILQLSQAIHDRSPLKVSDSNKVEETQAVYALGFPVATTAVADDQVYTSADVTITNGIVGKFQTVDNINFVLHNAALSSGNSGGPLVDSNGGVVGVNTMYSGNDGNNYYYSIAINEITEVLDALGIVYEKLDGAAAPAPVESEESVAAPAESVETTPSVETPASVEAPSIPTVTTPETPANNGNMMMIIIIAAVAFVVILVVIIIVVVVASSGKKNKRPAVQPMPNPMAQPPMGAPMAPQAPVAPQAPARPMPPTPPAPPVAPAGAGETSVLGLGAGETSVLGGGSSQAPASLIRKKNNETAAINKPNYAIGKERAKVDFCVPDNNSISRNHANIVYRDGAYYIVDNNSTNFTYVNGNKLSPRQEVKLNSGDKIKLADEEFEFRQ